MDFTADTIDERLERFLGEVEAETQSLRVLGYYENRVEARQL